MITLVDVVVTYENKFLSRGYNLMSDGSKWHWVQLKSDPGVFLPASLSDHK
jgi:hypothetical protein